MSRCHGDLPKRDHFVPILNKFGRHKFSIDCNRVRKVFALRSKGTKQIPVSTDLSHNWTGPLQFDTEIPPCKIRPIWISCWYACSLRNVDKLGWTFGTKACKNLRRQSIHKGVNLEYRSWWNSEANGRWCNRSRIEFERHREMAMVCPRHSQSDSLISNATSSPLSVVTMQIFHHMAKSRGLWQEYQIVQTWTYVFSILRKHLNLAYWETQNEVQVNAGSIGCRILCRINIAISHYANIGCSMVQGQFSKWRKDQVQCPWWRSAKMRISWGGRGSPQPWRNQE